MEKKNYRITLIFETKYCIHAKKFNYVKFIFKKRVNTILSFN